MDPLRTGDGWHRVDELFAAALGHPPGRREDFLAEACAGDAELEAAVRELLEAAGEADRLVARTRGALARAAAGAFGEEEPGAAEGRRIGPWRLVEEIGRGGMGAVYRAERADGAFEQEVALKLLRPGPEGAGRLARFLEERQILATLEHPGIARLLDGGATDGGRPYLVMEYVEGRPLTEHCEAEGLDLGERLELFCSVARAVEHAHRNLVVHRDLKPSNVLVTADGRVKLLDFGIAELQGEGPGATAGGGPVSGRALTPEYASPEQLAGEPVGVASDVYQLGILLHELLAGRRPGAPGAGATVGTRAVRDDPPPPPSQVAPPERRRQLRGDLDAIVLKAVRRAPGDRYGSAERMMRDVRRHLARRPVAARQGGWRYRAGRFVARNRWAVAAAVVLALLTAAYAVTVTVYADRLERERDVARRESEKAAQVQAFLVDLFRRPDPFAAGDDFRGSDLTVREALDLGLERARTELSSQPDVQVALLGTVADVYANLDLEERALEAERTALEVTRRVWGEASRRRLDELDAVATRLWQLGRYPEADSVYRREYLPLAAELEGPGSMEVARGLMGLGNVLSARSELTEAEAALDSADRLYRAAAGSHAELRAEILHNLANVRNRSGRPAAAEEAARAAVSIRRELSGPRHPHTAVALTALATALASQGRHEEAERVDRRALSILEERLGPTHDYTLSVRNNLAVRAAQREDHEEAARQHRRLLGLYREKLGERSSEVASSLQNLAVALARAGRGEEAADRAREAHRLYRETLGPGHFRTALPLLTLSEIQLEAGRRDEAGRTSRRAVEILEEALPEGHHVAAVARGRLGRALAVPGRMAEAEELLEGALADLRASSADTERYRREMLTALVELYRRWGRPADAQRARAELAGAGGESADGAEGRRR